jgi:hypothetical protein
MQKVYELKQPIKVYTCGIAFQYELGLTDVTVYPTIESCRQAFSCTDECGMVELEVKIIRWVEKQKL